MNAAPDHHHLHQRLKVGAVGLAIVVVLIVVAGAIMGSVVRPRPMTGRVDLATNLTIANDLAADEPLAQMGVAAGGAENKTAARR